MDDPDVPGRLGKEGITCSAVCMEKGLPGTGEENICGGNAPTALIRLVKLSRAGMGAPDRIIGVPVGFVNVVESKELIMNTKVPCIVTKKDAKAAVMLLP